MRTYLRNATEADMDLLFVWANDLVVRKNSFSTEAITYEEHKEWYRRLLTREDCAQYIYMCGGEAVGQARVTLSGETAEIGYSICAEKRGMGHGKELLRLLQAQVKKDFPDIKTLTARVKTGNLASQSAFLGVGYTKVYEAFELAVQEETRNAGREEGRKPCCISGPT